MSGPQGSSMVGGAWMALALALVAAFSVAEAGNGRISFSGAVVEPTCTVTEHQLAVSLAAQAANAHATQRLVCGRTATDAGRFYARTVVDLDADAVANSRLLDYFAGYANAGAADGKGAKLVVRTYE